MQQERTHTKPLHKDHYRLCYDCLHLLYSDEFRDALSNIDEFNRHPSHDRLELATYWITIQELEKASQEGCELCSAVVRTIGVHRYRFLSDGVEVTLFQGSSASLRRRKDNVDQDRLPRFEDEVNIRGLSCIAINAATSDSGSITELFWAHTDEDDPAACYMSTRDVNPVVDCEETWSKIDSWKTRCMNNHRACRSSSILPKRVLEVIDGREPRLSIDEVKEAPYAALSYCWGDHRQPMKLTHENLAEYSRRIDILKQPQTIQDAIKTTRKLGLKYIWIDSLCIIQDDTDDKRREIANMRNIFKNATITIIAASAGAVDTGFLGDNEPPPLPTIKLPYPCPNGEIGNIYLRKDNDYIQSNPLKWPSEQRAWTLEERALSTRKLIYTPTHIRWKCNDMQDCHGGHVYNAMDTLGRIGVDTLISGASNNTSEINFADLWISTIDMYTARAITRPKDKLLAISAIAEEISILGAGKYLAGIWEKYLWRCLLWRTANFGKRPTGQRPLKYRAPSWSWASVDGKITWTPYYEPDRSEHLEILHCDTLLVDESQPFGEVRAGSLIVKGRMRLAVWDPRPRRISENNMATYKTGYFMAANCLDNDIHSIVLPKDESWEDSKANSLTPSLEGGFYPDVVSAFDNIGVVICLEFGSSMRRETQVTSQIGLILVAVNDENAVGYRKMPVIYRRVGFFFICDPERVDVFEDCEVSSFTII